MNPKKLLSLLAILPLAAQYAAFAAPKEVTVVNEPLDVNVVSQPPADRLTHLGQPLDSHVNLAYAEDSEGICVTNFAPGPSGPRFNFVQLSPSGSTIADPFQVPTGHELVITDVFYVATRSDSRSLIGSVAELNIQNFDAATGAVTGSVLMLASKTVSDNDSFVADRIHLVAGLRIGAGKVPCAILTVRRDDGTRTFLRPLNDSLYIYGYLISTE